MHKWHAVHGVRNSRIRICNKVFAHVTLRRINFVTNDTTYRKNRLSYLKQKYVFIFFYFLRSS